MMYRLTLVILLGTALCDAHAGEWIGGSTKVVDGNTISIDGQQVVLDGILPIGSDALCSVGRTRFPCRTLAVSELGRMVSNQTVLCDVRSEDTRGRLIGRCVVDDRELASELIKLGLAEPDPKVDLSKDLDRADLDVPQEGLAARGGPSLRLPEPPGLAQPAEQPVPGSPVAPSSSVSRPTM